MLEEAGALSTTGATFHTLRHTNATLLLQAGVPVRVVSQRLGHKKVEITLGIYAHALPGQDEDAAEVAAGLFSGCAEPTMHISCTSEGKTKAAEAAL
jgi:integrase